VGTLIENLTAAFDQAITHAISSHATDSDSGIVREALLVAQNIIAAIAAETRVQGTNELARQRDGLAMMQAKHDATKLLLMPRL
jgi:hypothetical protein